MLPRLVPSPRHFAKPYSQLRLLQRSQSRAIRVRASISGRSNGGRLNLVPGHAVRDRAKATDARLVPVQSSSGNLKRRGVSALATLKM